MKQLFRATRIQYWSTIFVAGDFPCLRSFVMNHAVMMSDDWWFYVVGKQPLWVCWWENFCFFFSPLEIVSGVLENLTEKNYLNELCGNFLSLRIYFLCDLGSKLSMGWQEKIIILIYSQQISEKDSTLVWRFCELGRNYWKRKKFTGALRELSWKHFKSSDSLLASPLKVDSTSWLIKNLSFSQE